MIKVLSTVTSDAAMATRHILSGVLLLAGFNVCIAAGALVAGTVLKGFSTGIDHFLAVMSYSGVELVTPIPEAVAIFNWVTLAAMGLFACHSVGTYLADAARRSKPTAEVVVFPQKRIEAIEETLQSVANG